MQKSSLLAAAAAALIAGPALAVEIRTNPADFEARLNNSTGSYSEGPSETAARLRVGFQSNFGAPNAAAPGGGITALFYFQLPQLLPGQTIDSANFSTALLPEPASFRDTDITPRFNADLYGLGFTRTLPTDSATYTAASQDYYYAGNGPDAAAGEGGSVARTKIDDDFFNPFSDYEAVNPGDPNVPDGTALAKETDATADAALLNYVNSIYADPAFVNDGQSYLILRMNPDRASFETGFNGDPVANGSSRYSLPSGENAENVPQTVLSLNVVPEPASLSLLAIGATALFRRRRGA